MTAINLLVCLFLLGQTPQAAADEARPSSGATASDSKGGEAVTDETPQDEEPPAPRPNGSETLPGSLDTSPVKGSTKPEVLWTLGANYQFLIIPHFLLGAFLEAAKSPNHNLYRHGFGLHFSRRKKALDMVVRLMFGFMLSSKDDGNWLGKGHDWDELDYTEFHDLNFLWADITFIYNWEVAPHFFLGVGGGVGLGWVMGKVYTTPSSLNGTGTPCDSTNYKDCSTCHPSGAQCSSGSCDRASLVNNPDREKSGNVPPAMIALNGVFSMRYDFWRHMSARFNTGIFLPGFFSFELSLEWIF